MIRKKSNVYRYKLTIVRFLNSVKIYVEVPKNLTKKQKDLLKEFENSLSDKNYAKRQSFFEKLKAKLDF